MTKRRTMKARKRAPRAPKALPSLDPVSAYARDVLEGRVVAGRAVRLACERHERNLTDQGTAAFPFVFDESAARRIIEFFPAFLTLENGDPFVLAPWQQFCLGSIFGWKHQDSGLRRFQTGYEETGKGSGKTPTLGGVGNYGLAFDGENAAEIYSAAFDKGQASLILNDGIRMAEASPDLGGRGDEAGIFEVGKYNISHPPSRSFFRAVSSEHRGKSGPRPHMVLIDELHEHRDGTVVNKLRAGFKFRKQPLLLAITNSGHDRTSICWSYHEHSLKVLESAIVDEAWFAYVCQLDPCDACFASGHRQPQEDCAACDDWTNPAVWPKANPALGITIQLPYLQSQVDLALAMPSEQALVKRLNFCIWTETHSVWIAPDKWQACQAATVFESLDGARAAAFDMSEKLDLTACVVGRKIEDEPITEATQHIEIIEREGEQEIKKRFALNFYVELETFFWLPKDTLIERVKSERVPLDVWERAGMLRVTDGPVIDYDLIYEQFTTEIGPTFQPQRIGYDGHNASQFALQLRDKGKFTIAEIAQGRKLSETFKLFEALVMLKRIRHRGNPVMSWCVSNAEPKRDRYENLWIEKPSKTKRIDGLIAAVMVLHELMVLPAKKFAMRRRAPKIWTRNGWVESTMGATRA